MANPDPQPLESEADEAVRLYQLLAAQVEPTQGDSGRRPAPASRPPLAINPVSLMAELEDFLRYWTSQARYFLNPWRKIDVTARTGARCPWCGGNLTCWIHPAREEDAQIICTSATHNDTAPSEPSRWRRIDWPRLGVLTGVHIDTPSGRARPPWDELERAAGE